MQVVNLVHPSFVQQIQPFNPPVACPGPFDFKTSPGALVVVGDLLLHRADLPSFRFHHSSAESGYHTLQIKYVPFRDGFDSPLLCSSFLPDYYRGWRGSWQDFGQRLGRRFVVSSDQSDLISSFQLHTQARVLFSHSLEWSSRRALPPPVPFPVRSELDARAALLFRRQNPGDPSERILSFKLCYFDLFTHYSTSVTFSVTDSNFWGFWVWFSSSSVRARQPLCPLSPLWADIFVTLRVQFLAVCLPSFLHTQSQCDRDVFDKPTNGLFFLEICRSLIL